MKRWFSLLAAVAALSGILSGCGSREPRVYYLNFKPEQDAAWQRLAADYTEETGVEVKVVTAAQGTYEQTLTAEIDKRNAPTLFQVSGAVALEAWGDRCLDLKDTAVYAQLSDDAFALKDGDKVCGVAYAYEGYGLIVNKKLLKKAGFSLEEIDGFPALKRVAESITARQKELGFAAFTAPGLDSSSSWRFSGHLANMPLFYEFEEDGVTDQPARIRGTYLDNYKALWDLYIQNTTQDPRALTSVTGDMALAEFRNEKAVFYQNGTWEYDNVKEIGDENLGFLPLYTGVRDQQQGLCAGTENYWAVNADASEEDRKATLDFLEWVVTSERGTDALAKEMGFLSPFRQAKPVENVLCNLMNESVEAGKEPVTWAFSLTPNVDAWRADLVSALAAYSAGKWEWSAVEQAFVDGWATQYDASKR